MLRDRIKHIFEKAQQNTACHQKYIRMLIEIYDKTTQDDFIDKFLTLLLPVVNHTTDKNAYVTKALLFTSRFCGEVTRKEDKDADSHQFLSRVIETALQWSCLNSYVVRYTSCCLITMVLQDIGEEIQLEIALIDEIQRVMLERMNETKVAIRLKAMSALVRLQDPPNHNCPVIKAYLEALMANNAQIRRDAVALIAPSGVTLNKIRERIADVDHSVRTAAFRKCAEILPHYFKIVDKHMILKCGFHETHAGVKNTFYNYFLPKWLTAFKGKFLDFIAALKLIANEEDLITMVYLNKELMKHFYKEHPISDLVAVLPIEKEHKLIKIEDINTNLTLYWNILVDLLRNSDDEDEQLDSILPELSPFCHYIERLMKTKEKETMDEWKYFEYQFDLLNLFGIAENYDLSDEIGRRTLQSLAMSVLNRYNFTPKLTKKLVAIAHKCSTNIEFFTNDMCQLISEIREPLTEEVLTEDQQRKRDFEVAKLKVKINELQEEQEQAVAARNYLKAQLLQDELTNCKREMEKSQNCKVVPPEKETLCRCLDILIGVLELEEVKKMTPSLVTCKDLFLVPLISSQNAEQHWRVLRCLVLFSIIDKASAEEYAKIVLIPIAIYRTVRHVDSIPALLESITGVADLIVLYGAQIVGATEEDVNDTSNEQATRRRLYNNGVEEDVTVATNDNITFSKILEIFLDMLDDEHDEVRHKAAAAIISLVRHSFNVTTNLMSRILLKWFNPLTVKCDTVLQVRLGYIVKEYLSCQKSVDVLREAIIPTLSDITNAPRTSPLADIDIDVVLTFFAQVMNVKLSQDGLKILALDICMKISEDIRDYVVTPLTKLLCHLHIEGNVESSRELIDRVETLYEDIREKIPKKYIEKFLSNLRQQAHSTTNMTEGTNNTTEEVTMNDNVPSEPNNSPVPNENVHQSPPKKRRKRNKECVVLLQKLNNSVVNAANLSKVIENGIERMQIDDELHISTPSSENSDSSCTRRSSRRGARQSQMSVGNGTMLYTIIENGDEPMQLDGDADIASSMTDSSEFSSKRSTDGSNHKIAKPRESSKRKGQKKKKNLV